MKQGSVYILTNKRNGTLYIGVTSNLPQRIWQHREGLIEGFTKNTAANCLSGTSISMIFRTPAAARPR